VKADLARGAIDVAKEAIQADAYDAATQLLETGLTLAKKVSGGKYRDPNTIHQANELRGLIPWYKEQYNLAQQAEKALARDPTNEKALQFLGKYYVLLKDSGDRGLPLLVKSGDPALKALAEAVQAMPRSPAAGDIVKLGHLWRTAAADMDERWRRLALQRALYCYETALPKLKGFPQTQVAGFIAELKQAETTRRKP
jgi:hypothetical protein